jgi:uncharacterized protein YndB with AHSA1/START domain
MKKVLLGVLALVVIAALAVVGFAMTRPATYRVERQTTIAAAPVTVYAAVEDFNRWPEWSPWEKLDPTMTRDIGGAPRGAGSVYEWSGNSKVGKGRMTIVDATPPARIDIKLEFIEPWQATNQTRFAFTPVGDGTQVTWTMDGQNNFMSKVMSVFMSIEGMVARDFEKGLASLKQVAERSPPTTPASDTTATDTTAVPGA